MNVLITGGTGFIGSRLALTCLDQGERVRILAQANNDNESRNSDMIRARGGEVILGSVTDPDALRKALADVEVVYHLAAAQHEANVPDQRFRDVNVTGTEKMLEASVREGVKRFVHGSTIGVYGGVKGETVRDDSPLAPTNIYGTTKLEAEKVVESYRDKLPVVTARISETYGPGDGRLLKLYCGVRKKSFFMVGSGANLHHLIYIDDLIEGLRRAATVDTAIGKTFVLAGPEPTSSRDMIATVAKTQGVKPPWLRMPMGPMWLLAIAMEMTLGRIGIQPPLHRRRLNFFILSFAFSGEEARSALGIQPKVGFEQGAEQTAAWYREEGLL